MGTRGEMMRMSEAQSFCSVPLMWSEPISHSPLQKSIASDTGLEDNVAGPKQIDHCV